MAYWMELRCDVQHIPDTPAGELPKLGCWSHSSHAGLLVESSAAAVEAGRRLLNQSAKMTDWKRKRDRDGKMRWVCPECLEHFSG